MQSTIFTIVALLCIFQGVHAFTIGYLLPSYICGPPTDGLPKSLGTYLPYVQRATAATGNAFTAPRLDYPLDAAVGGSTSNTKYVLANWHNRNNTVACNFTIFVNTSLTNHPTVVNKIVPGQLHDLTLLINGKFDPNTNTLSQCDFYTSASQVTATDLANIAIDGAVVYAMNASGVRVGNFTNFGKNTAGVTTMQPWAACGPLNTGIVHNQLIDNNVGYYAGIQWLAPANLQVGSNITFTGAAVADTGFGKHKTVIPIVLPGSVGIALPVATPWISLVIEFGPQLAVFFVDNAKNAPAANAPVIPNLFTVKAKFGTTVVQVNVTKSPALLDITAMKGQTITVTVTALNTVLASIPTTSTPVTLPVSAGPVVKQPDVDKIINLCPADVINDRMNYGQEPDPDNQCDFQFNYISGAVDAANTPAGTSAAAPKTAALPIIAVFTLALAALMFKL